MSDKFAFVQYFFYTTGDGDGEPAIKFGKNICPDGYRCISEWISPKTPLNKIMSWESHIFLASVSLTNLSNGMDDMKFCNPTILLCDIPWSCFIYDIPRKNYLDCMDMYGIRLYPILEGNKTAIVSYSGELGDGLSSYRCSMILGKSKDTWELDHKDYSVLEFLNDPYIKNASKGGYHFAFRNDEVINKWLAMEKWNIAKKRNMEWENIRSSMKMCRICPVCNFVISNVSYQEKVLCCESCGALYR